MLLSESRGNAWSWIRILVCVMSSQRQHEQGKAVHFRSTFHPHPGPFVYVMQPLVAGNVM